MKAILASIILLSTLPTGFAQNGDPRIAVYEKEIAGDSTSAQAHFALASILALDSTHYSRAEKEYTKAIELDSLNPYYVVARADLYFRQKKYSLAIEDAGNIRQLEGPDSYWGNKIYVLCLHAQEETERLKKFLRMHPLHEVSNSPPDPEFQYFLGELYESWEEPSWACTYFQQAVMDIESLQGIVEKGSLDKQLKQYEAKVSAICR